MFKTILEIEDVDTAQLIDSAFKAINEAPLSLFGGLKLPPFFNGAMLKALPKDNFIKIFEQAFNSDPDKMLPMVEKALVPVFGDTKLGKASCKSAPRPGVALSIDCLVEKLDDRKLLERTASQYLDEESYREIMAGTNPSQAEVPAGAFDKASAIKTLMGLGDLQKEYAALKLLSLHKKEVIEQIGQLAKSKGVPLTVASIRFLMPK